MFRTSGELDGESNVQFGAGGAGTFSDGKLVTRIHDPRCRFVLETFHRFGAPDEILTLAKPHIGTDILAGVIKNMRQAMEARGARFCFENCMTDYRREVDGKMFVEVNHKEWIETSRLVLAIGHSARDTFEMLNDRKSEFPFANSFISNSYVCEISIFIGLSTVMSKYKSSFTSEVLNCFSNIFSLIVISVIFIS